MTENMATDQSSPPFTAGWVAALVAVASLVAVAINGGPGESAPPEVATDRTVTGTEIEATAEKVEVGSLLGLRHLAQTPTRTYVVSGFTGVGFQTGLVAAFEADGAELWRIEMEGWPALVAADEESVWVALGIEGTVVRLDPDTGTEFGRVTPGLPPSIAENFTGTNERHFVIQQMVTGLDSVWIHTMRGAVGRINPDLSWDVAETPPFVGGELAVADDSVLLAAATDGLVTVDAETMETATSDPLAHAVEKVGFSAVPWVAGPDPAGDWYVSFQHPTARTWELVQTGVAVASLGYVDDNFGALLADGTFLGLRAAEATIATRGRTRLDGSEVVEAGHQTWQRRFRSAERLEVGELRTIEVERPDQPVLAPGWERMEAWEMPRWGAFTADTGTHLLAWGGRSVGNDSNAPDRADGVLIEHATGDTVAILAAPICVEDADRAVWTGREMIVWTVSNDDPCINTAAAYMPATRSWRVLRSEFFDDLGPDVLWSGSELLAWREGMAFDPGSGRVRSIALPDDPPDPSSFNSTPPRAWWTGETILVLGEGGLLAYEAATDTWSTEEGPPVPSQARSSVWNGSHLLAVDYQMEAALYDPAARAWDPIEPLPLRFYECLPQPFSDGEVTVVTMCSGSAVLTGETWTPIPLTALDPGIGFNLSGDPVLAGGWMYLLGEELWRRPAPTGAFEDLFPVDTFLLEIPDGWSASNGTAGAMSFRLTGPDGAVCSVVGIHAELEELTGESVLVERARDGRRVTVVVRSDSTVIVDDPNGSDRIELSCPDPADALLLARHLWSPWWR